MIFAYLIFFVVGIIIFFLLAKFRLPLRASIALAVFLFPSIILTAWVIQTGDTPPPDAITIAPKHSETEGKPGHRK